jgi:NADPH:quinone reductase-like Zn-dependent oxidoreductase
MKAVCYYNYGSPEQLKLTEVPMPALRPDHVLVRVHAASINSWDYDMLRGHIWITRVLSGLKSPKYQILGSDVAGVVEAVGSACCDWQPGDEVFGDIASVGFGSFAEYVAVPEKQLARKPANISFKQAAALPQAGLLAIQGIRFHGDVVDGQQILINGAGGGVGPIALTYAKSKGAHVTCVDRSEKFEMLRALGADVLIDYTTTDFTRTGKKYDKILDVIAHRATSDYQRVLTSSGVFAMIGGSMGGLLFRMMAIEPLLSKYRSQKLGIMGYEVNREGLDELARLLSDKTIVVAIDRTFPLTQLREAFDYFETGKFKGKIVIEVITK